MLLQRCAVVATLQARTAAAAATLRCTLRAAQRSTLSLAWRHWWSVVLALSGGEHAVAA